MTAIIHRTPGTLDMRAFTTMGMSAKPETDRPIGVFGTGLKYAVAVLVRMGAKFEVHTGGHRYWFETTAVDFRGAEFQQIVMRRDSWVTSGVETGWRWGRRQKLPFTTQYGRNWQTWMAFRELYSNTLDEGGDTLELTDDQWALKEHAPNRWANTEGGTETIIAIHNCEEYTKAYRDRANVFLDLGDRDLRAALPGLEVHHGSRQRMFYQGLRALDLGKPALFTYNVTAPQHLTEDRQLGREWAVRDLVANTIATCDDEELIATVIKADKDHWEHGLQPSTWISPSDAFHRVMARRPRGVGAGWGSYYGSHDVRPEAVRSNPWDDALRPWRVDGGDVLDAAGNEMMSRPMTLSEPRWALLAERVVKLANASKEPLDPVMPEVREMLLGDIYEGGFPGYLGLGPDVQLLYDPTQTPRVDENGDDIPF